MKTTRNSHHLCLKTGKAHLHKFFLMHRTLNRTANSGAGAPPGDQKASGSQPTTSPTVKSGKHFV